jgi:tRNA pseudouridine55 synthase
MHDLVLNLDKPKGITSQEAVTRVKRLFRAKKAGHAGTLDPMATGVLIICLNEATKITRFLSDLDKEYLAELRLGQRTDTYDAEGRVVEKVEGFSVEEEEVRKALEAFRGEITQLPPMYSAVKVSGRPLYKLARKGLTAEVPERKVFVSALSLTRFDPPWVELRVSCSKGTYIRTLADDIGRALGTGAHVTALRRLRIGDFTERESAPLEEIVDKPSARRSIDTSLAHLRQAVLKDDDYARALNGRPVPLTGLEVPGEAPYPPGSYVRLKDPGGRLFAVGLVAETEIKIERLLHI